MFAYLFNVGVVNQLINNLLKRKTNNIGNFDTNSIHQEKVFDKISNNSY